MPKLNIGAVMLPQRTHFKPEIEELLNACLKGQGRVRQANKQSIKSLHQVCKYMIDGMYQAWCSITPNTVLELPTSPQAFHSTKPGKINNLSHRSVICALETLKALRWARVVTGYQTAYGKNILTRVSPTGALLDRFKLVGLEWQALTPLQKGIVLRRQGSKSGTKVQLQVPDSRAVRNMQNNLRRINMFLAQQAICLHLSNANIAALGAVLAKNGRPLIFTHVAMRRIFSRGSLKKGGRFYGGWWEWIPSSYRPYLTINGLATVEVDFSELHPRLLYLRLGLPVPSGDLYDDGWRDPAHPVYDASIQPYAARRMLFKRVFNAILNDESGRFRLEQSDYAAAQALGLNVPTIRERIFNRHPALRTFYRTGVGLDLQYADSQIAETVMLTLIEQGIPCLAVHDSFIAPRHQSADLIKAMKDAFKKHTGHSAALKLPESFATDFRLPFKPNGELDQQAMIRQHDEAIHNHFNQSRHRAIQQHRERTQEPPTM